MLALPHLYDNVVARFALDNDPPAATQYFGWRDVARSHVGNRIIWTPGAPDGNAGELVAPRYPGRNPRGLMNLVEAFHCHVTGYDVTAPQDERLQYIAARLLYDALIRAIYLAAHGTFTVTSNRWVTDKKEFRAGATILLTGTIRAVQPDAVDEVAPADAGAIIGITQLDVVEVLCVPEGHTPAA